MFILERYLTKKESYLKAHKSSPIFFNFREKLQEMQAEGHVTLDGHSYLETGVGYVSRE